MREEVARRVVLITGASGGLGRALCQAFASAGARIAAHVYQNRVAGERLVQELCQAGAEAQLLCADLRCPESVRQMFDSVRKKWDGLDVLINNAAISDHARFVHLSEDVWDDVLAVNLSGPFFCMREAGRWMSHAGQGQGQGHIVNIVSHARLGRVGQAAYAASKCGLSALTQSAAREWEGVCVNAVAPGFLETKMTAALSPARRQALIQENCLRRPSTFEEVCDFVVRLSHMQHVSGQLFTLDSRIIG